MDRTVFLANESQGVVTMEPFLQAWYRATETINSTELYICWMVNTVGSYEL